MAVKALLTDEYISEVFFHHKGDWVKFVVITAAFLGSIAGIYHAVRFNLYVPAQYIPADNVFDLYFYWDKVKMAVATGNLSRTYRMSSMELLIQNTMCVNLFFLVSAMILFIPILFNVKLARLCGESMIFVLKGIGVAVLMAFLLYCFCVWIFGLSFEAYVEGVAFTLLLVMLRAKKYSLHLTYESGLSSLLF